MRIDDLDPPRTVPGAADDILRMLESCAMQWDGPVLFQSARNAAYRDAFDRLLQQGLVYPCSCSRREIADSAVPGLGGYVYPGTCRSGLREGRQPRTWRIRTAGASVELNDDVQGRIVQDLERESGDFVLYRADGVYAYQLAAAVDDAGQRITHVVRGADLLVSTPRQIYLQRLLGLPTPLYAHLPVAVNAQGEKLSKQTHAAPLDPANPVSSLIAALEFLGHRPPPDIAASESAELWRWAIANWSLQRVPRAPLLRAPD